MKRSAATAIRPRSAFFLGRVQVHFFSRALSDQSQKISAHATATPLVLRAMPRTTRTGNAAPDRWSAAEDFERQLRIARQAERAAAAARAQDDVQQPAVALADAGQVINAAPVIGRAPDDGTEIADWADVGAVDDEDGAALDEAAVDEAVVDGSMAREEDEAELAQAERVANAAARAAAVNARAEADAARAAAAAAARGAAANVIRPAFSRPVASAAAALPNIARGKGKGNGAKRHRKV